VEYQNEYDQSGMVLSKIKDLRSKHRKPVSVNLLAAELAGKISKVDMTEILNHLNEMGEIRQVPGPELCYELY